MSLPPLHVFIPAYEAAATLPSVFERIPPQVWEAACEVLVINDGSTDDTSDVVRREQARFPKLQLQEQPENRGYGAAVRKGLARSLETPARYVACLHADGQYPPEKLPPFVEAMEKGGMPPARAVPSLWREPCSTSMPPFSIASTKGGSFSGGYWPSACRHAT